MKINKLYILLGLLVAFAVFFELAAHADESNEYTRITFSAPIQIPGQVLPAGTYIFQQAMPDDNSNVIQVFNSDRTVLYETLPTVSTERATATSHTAITLSEPESGIPLLVKWFYPGSLDGHEFVYSGEQEHEIALAKQETLVGNEIMSKSAGE